MPEIVDAPVTPPADAPAEGAALNDWADDGGTPPTDTPPVDAPPVDTPPVDDSTLPGGDQPPVDTPPADEVPPDPNAPPAPSKPQTPQELAADATLKKAYRDNFGKVQEIIKANPALRPVFFKAAELNEIYTTVEDAKQAKEWATQLYQFDNLYYSNKPEDTRAFLQALYENSKDDTGAAPHYDRLATAVVGDGLGNLAQRIQANDGAISRAFSDLGLNGKQALVAVQAVAAMFGIPLNGVKFSSGGAPTPVAPGTKPAEISEREQWLANEVSRLNSELENGRSTTLAQQEQNFYNGIQSKFTGNLDVAIDKALEPATALKSQKPGFQTWVKDQIRTRTKDAVRSDTFFANQMEAMARSGNRGPEHQQSLIAALEQRARQFLPDVLRDVLADAGIQIEQKTNAARPQGGTPRREPVTSGTPGRLTKPGERQTPTKPSGGYSSYADELLGIK